MFYRRIIYILLLLPLSAQAQDYAIAIDSLWSENSELHISFSADDIFDEVVLTSLQKGISIAINYEINIWKKRGIWFDQNVGYEEIEFRVKFNKFDQRYTWASFEERRTTASFDKIKILTLDQHAVPIANVADLESGNDYFIAIKGVIKPHSIEDFDDVKDWLSGEVKDVDLKELKKTRESQEKVSGRVFSIFKNIAGFGDRIYEGISEEFRISEYGNVQFGRKILVK